MLQRLMESNLKKEIKKGLSRNWLITYMVTKIINSEAQRSLGKRPKKKFKM